MFRPPLDANALERNKCQLFFPFWSWSQIRLLMLQALEDWVGSSGSGCDNAIR